MGNYELLGELGRGGMGVVYKARQKRADRLVALKVIHARVGADDQAKARFAAEARALARISHPNIVAVYEVGEDSDCSFFTMEFVDGVSLSRRLREGEPFTPTASATLLEGLARAVQAAHDVGVIHRDIKPGNVLIGSNGAAKLTDFGLAKHLDQSEGLTIAGSALGTPSYMPPEQAAGQLAQLGPTADVYSLGATLYELLTGRPPFRGESPAAIILRVLRDEVVSPRQLRPELSPELEAICLRCLEKNPANRYATATALADDLARWRMGQSTIARPLSRARRFVRGLRRNWRSISLATLVVVGLALAAVIGALWPEKPPPNPLKESIEPALARGERVELIGPTGEPRYKRWVVGVGETNAGTNTPFEVFAADQGLLELVSDVQTDRYRFSAEFQSASSTKPLSNGGIYFGHRKGIENHAGRADRVVLLYYHDDLINNDHETATPVTVQYAFLTQSPDTPFCCSLALLASHSVKERKVLHRPWRRVEVEVTPEGIAARWCRAPGEELVSIGRALLTAASINRQGAAQCPNVLQTSPGIDLTGWEFNPRGGVGLYLTNAKVYFRNVVIEPLPSPTP